MNQRFRWLSFTSSNGALTIAAPTSANRTPPGHYLLFILDGNGVPSVASIVKVGSSSEPPPPPSSSLSLTGRVDPTKQSVPLVWSGVSGATVDVYQNGLFLKNTANTGKHTNSVVGLSAATYTYKVWQKGTTTCSREATVTFAGGPLP
jgi:galactose oxidase-like protein